MPATLQKHTITAFYESRDYADAAATKLRASSVPASDITVSPESARDEYGLYGEDVSTQAAPKTGFWASLEELFGGTDDHHTYAEGVRRGHVMLTAHVTDAQLEPSIAIIEEHGSIDLDEHEETWRREGWTGAPATASASVGPMTYADTSTDAAMTSTGMTGTGAAGLAMTEPAPAITVVSTETRATAPAARAVAPTATRTTATTGGDEVLQVVEERLNVGKRAVSRGKVRLHSYVVEEQVSEDVTLHNETVTVDRRAVDRPVAALGADAFQERTIEMEEVDEEAVVGKSARVVEEIGIRKDAIDRVETIRDTVRSTRVDVEDERTGGTAGTAAGRFAVQIRADMEVVGSDGVRVGTVDHLEGGRIKLKKADAASGGVHHFLTQDVVQSVAGKVVLAVTAAEAKARWATA